MSADGADYWLAAAGDGTRGLLCQLVFRRLQANVSLQANISKDPIFDSVE